MLLHQARPVDHEIVAELRPREDEIWLSKHRFSCFHQTGLDLALRSAGIEALVVCGLVASGSIYTTVIDANMHGYFAFVPESCIGATMRVPDMHEAAMTIIGPRNIIDVPLVLDAWRT
jgi:nicotinamidase-related amidase